MAKSIADVAITLGSVGPIVIREGSEKTEAFLRGRLLDEETMRLAGDIAIAEITPISDVRGAADYRYQLTRNIFVEVLPRDAGDY